MIDASDLFDIKSTYFNTAYIGPTPKRARDKMVQLITRSLSPCPEDLEHWFEGHDRVRTKLAKLMQVPPENLSLSTSVSESVSHVANGLSLGPDDEVLLMDGDYPSMILPWLVAAKSRGFKVRLLDLSAFLEPKRLSRELTAHTKLVGCSHVMFNTGATLPIAELAQTCHSHSDALFISDVSQSFGGLTLDSEIIGSVDILVGVTYKWLLGPYGSAFGYFSDHALALVARTHASKLSSALPQSHQNMLNYTTDPMPGARRFDRGQAQSFLMCAGLEGALDILLEVGLDRIQAHNRSLVELFFEHLPDNFEVASPRELRSNIICVKPRTRTAEQLKEQLTKSGFELSLREGMVRLAFHFFNTPKQVQRLLEVIG